MAQSSPSMTSQLPRVDPPPPIQQALLRHQAVLRLVRRTSLSLPAPPLSLMAMVVVATPLIGSVAALVATPLLSIHVPVSRWPTQAHLVRHRAGLAPLLPALAPR